MSTATLRRHLQSVSAELTAHRATSRTEADRDADTDARMAILTLLAYAARIDARHTPQRDQQQAAAQMQRLMIGDPRT